MLVTRDMKRSNVGLGILFQGVEQGRLVLVDSIKTSLHSHSQTILKNTEATTKSAGY
jgi:hypothetical protein